MPTVHTLIPASFSRKDTATYTLDDIRKEVNEICIWLDYIWGHEKKMQDIQFHIGWNEKPRPKSLGLCHKDSDYKYVLTFSHRYFEVALPRGVHEVILHEVLHATKNGMKHTGEWKYKANYVSNFTEFKVTRCVNPEDAPAWYAQETAARLGGAKYQVVCPVCNKVIATRSRMCKLIEHPERYRCGKCYCNKLEVKTLF